MSDKWYVIKISEEHREKYSIPNGYVVMKYREGLETIIIKYGDTTVLVTPSEDVAYGTKRALDEQLRKQSN